MKRRCSICGFLLEPDSTICSCCGTSVLRLEADSDIILNPWKDLEEMDLTTPDLPEPENPKTPRNNKKNKNYQMVLLLVLTVLATIWIICSILTGQPRSISMLIVFILPFMFGLFAKREDKRILTVGIIVLAAIFLTSIAVEGRGIVGVLLEEMNFSERTSLLGSKGSELDYIPLEEVLIEEPMFGRGVNQLDVSGMIDLSDDALPMVYYCLYADHTYWSSSDNTGTYTTYGYKNCPFASDSSFKSAVKAIKKGGYKAMKVSIVQINDINWYFAVPDDWHPGEDIYYVERIWSINNSAPVEDIHLVKVRTWVLPEDK